MKYACQVGDVVELFGRPHRFGKIVSINLPLDVDGALYRIQILPSRYCIYVETKEIKGALSKDEILALKIINEI